MGSNRTRVALRAIAAASLFASPGLEWWHGGAAPGTASGALYDLGVVGMIATVFVVVAGLVAALAARSALAGHDATVLGRPLRLVSRGALATSAIAVVDAAMRWDGTPSWGAACALAGAALAMISIGEEATADSFGAARSATPVAIARVVARERAAATSGLRFAVASATLEPDGLRAGDRLLAWRDVARVIARRLPPDPPWHKATFVDLVPATGAPMRIAASTRIDFAALPGGAAPTAKGNWRRLVAVARHANTAIEIDAASAPFFDGGEAPIFPAWKKFLEYDAGYDAT